MVFNKQDIIADLRNPQFISNLYCCYKLHLGFKDKGLIKYVLRVIMNKVS